jgi:hypothetical protein
MTSPPPTTPPVIMDSDTVVLTKFGLTDFNAQLKSVEDTLLKYNVQEIDPANTKWRNIVNVIDKLTKLSINISNLKEFIVLMVDFKADKISKWYDVMEQLTYVKIKGFTNIKGFIELIIKFDIIYSQNFKDFINIIVIFKADLSTSLIPIRNFVEDMIYVGYKYNVNRKNVDDIIYYFIACKYTLYSYSDNFPSTYSSERCIKDKNVLPPSGLPSKIVRSFYDYRSPNLQNDLYDIRNVSLLENIPFCDTMDAMHQAYMIASPNTKSYNKITQNFSDQITKVLAFLYKEELEKIITKPTSYTDYKKRVAIIRDMKNGMIRYTESLKEKAETIDDYKLYLSLSKTMDSFPVLCFQILSNYILKKCKDTNCDLLQYVDTDFTFHKARSDGKPTNYRKNDPVL